MGLETDDQNVFKPASLKYWVGLIMVHLFIPLVLLVSAWDFGWWQGWLYSSLIIVAGIDPRLWAEISIRD